MASLAFATRSVAALPLRFHVNDLLQLTRLGKQFRQVFPGNEDIGGEIEWKHLFERLVT
jgi:hypothetical protein